MQSATPRARARILDRLGQILAIFPEDRRGQRQVRGTRAHLGDGIDEHERPLARHQIPEEPDHPGVGRTAEFLQKAGAGAAPVHRGPSVSNGLCTTVHLRAGENRPGFGRGELRDGDHPISRPGGEIA